MSLFFLAFFSLAMSFGSNKASSTTEATWHPMPPLKSLIDASSLRGSPPCMGASSQACDSGGWVSDLSWPRCKVWLVFCCFAARWASFSRVGRDFPVSTMSFPFCSLRLFKSAASALTDWRGCWGGWCEAGGGDLVGGGGIWDCVDLLGALFPGWFSINSIRLLWGFLCTPISSGSSSKCAVWSKISKSSEESDNSTTSSRFSSSSFSFSSSSSFSFASCSLRASWDEEASTEAVATKRGWVWRVSLGSGTPSGMMNP